MIAHVDNRITYNGNGNATEFAYQFKILDRTDIKVLLTDADGKEKLLTKDYYVDVEKNVVRYPGYAVGAEVPEGERPAVLPAGWKLTIYREVPVTQETDLPDQYPFNQVEAIGDKLTMIAQQLTDTTGRSLKIGVSKSTDIDTVIPWENGKSFRISDDGKTLELSEDPAKVLPLAQGVYTQTQAQAQSAAASARLAEDYKNAAETAKNDASLYATNAKNSAGEAKTYMDNAKRYSENVNVFTPSVSSDGVLSWTNKAGLANPAPVNVKGKRGEKGEQGPQGLPGAKGEKGDKGDAFKYTDFTASQLTALKGPKGDTGNTGPQGLQGPAGNAATITIGNVTTSAPGTSASVTNRGTPSAAVLDFVLPKGKDGADGGVNVDDALSDTSTNPVQNKVVKKALDKRAVLNVANIFTKENAFQKGMRLSSDYQSAITWYRNNMQTFVASIDGTNYTGNAASATKATQDSEGNVITETYAKKADVSGVVKSVNGTKPDSNGNVTIAVSSGGGVSTSESNTWTAQQNFHDLMLNLEKYTTYVVNGISDTPITSTMVYAVTGAFTLDLATLAGALSASQSSVFTAYFAANADYSLTISNAGNLKYVGSASDVAITSAGLLLNIWMSKDGGGTLTSIVQASKLS